MADYQLFFICMVVNKKHSLASISMTYCFSWKTVNKRPKNLLHMSYFYHSSVAKSVK